MQGNKKNSIAKQAAILSIAGIIVRIIGLLYRIPVSKIIGDIGNSYYGIAFNIYTILLLLSGYSIPIVVSKLISNYRAIGQYKNAHKIFKTSLILISIVSGVLSLILFIFSPYFLPVGNEKAVFAVKALAPTLFISGIIGVFQGYFQSCRNSIPTALAQIAEQVINATTSIFFAYLLTRYALDDSTEIGSLGALGSTLGTLFGAVTSVTILYLIYKKFNTKRIYAELKRDKSNHILKSSIVISKILILLVPIILSTLITNITSIISQYIFFAIMNYKGIDTITSGIDYGIYIGKYTPIMNLPLAISTSVSIATLPAISMALAQKNIRKIRATVYESTALSFIFAIPSSVGLFVLSKPIMDLLFSNTPDVGYISLMIGSITIALSSYSIVLSGVLQGLGKPIITLIAGIISTLINVITLIPLLLFTNLGIYSVIFASIISTLTLDYICYKNIKNLIHYKQPILKSIILPSIASIIMGFFCYIIYAISLFILRFNILALIITVPLCVIIYALMIIKTGIISINQIHSISVGKTFIKLMRRLKLI